MENYIMLNGKRIPLTAEQVKIIINSISPIIDKNCINMAKSIATKIANEQATVVMNNYKYEDLCTITKDNNGCYRPY